MEDNLGVARGDSKESMNVVLNVNVSGSKSRA